MRRRDGGARACPARPINLNHPTDIQFSPDGGTLFLAAWHNHKIRQLDVATGLVDVVCGRGPGFCRGDGGPDAAALLNQPKAIALAPSGDLFVVDTRNFRMRRIAADTGIIEHRGRRRHARRRGRRRRSAGGAVRRSRRA